MTSSDQTPLDKFLRECEKCKGTGWRKYDHNHTVVCEYCCTHSEGWWEITEHYSGYKEGEDNACCKKECGTMRRDITRLNQMASGEK